MIYDFAGVWRHVKIVLTTRKELRFAELGNCEGFNIHARLDLGPHCCVETHFMKTHFLATFYDIRFVDTGFVDTATKHGSLVDSIYFFLLCRFH